MKVHVVYAHPLKTSLAARLHETVVTNLTAAGHEVDDLDLYADGFNPVLSPEGRSDYHEVPKNRELVDDYVTRLQACEALVFAKEFGGFIALIQKCLIQGGVTNDVYGNTVLDDAIGWDDKVIIELLRSRGAKTSEELKAAGN